MERKMVMSKREMARREMKMIRDGEKRCDSEEGEEV